MRVDFHVNVDHRLHYACRLLRKARKAGKTVLAYSSNADCLARLDAALWTFSALDFLPHVYADSPLAAETPIWLSLNTSAPARDVLINLDDAVPPTFETWFPQFERVIEVVSNDAAELAAARLRFKTYRDAGFEPVKHEIAAD